MSEYSTTIERLEEMKPRFDEGFTLSDRGFLDGLHHILFRKIITLTGCSDCYRDAYIIMYNKLKRDGKMPEQSNYSLLPGALIHFFGESEYYTNDVTDDVAERYLKQDASNIKYFGRYPENWKERITEDAKPRKTRVKTPKTTEE